MKKYILIIITLLLCTLLGACTVNENIEATPTPTATEEPAATPQPAATPKPTSSPTPTPQPTPEPTPAPLIKHKEEGGVFELPVIGATGYASITINLHEGDNTSSPVITTLSPGFAFLILEEVGGMWKIEIGESIGYVDYSTCLINLPDVIPSMVYDNTNASASKFVSSGFTIPNITGQKLYDAKSYNERIMREEYISPVLYATAKKITQAQDLALKDGNTLIINEAFRPYDTQMRVVNEMSALINSNPTVKNGVTQSPWAIGWFIAQGVSNHQQGYAIDVSLGKIDSQVEVACGKYEIAQITGYTEHQMPTSIHELSTASAAFAYPISSVSATEWTNTPAAPTMTQWSLLMQSYCTSAGLTPLASEWWHFNDLDAMNVVRYSGSNGNYFLNAVYSTNEPFSVELE